MSVLGIDLGTTKSCVAIYNNGQVEVIENDLGKRVTPSYFSFAHDEYFVGEAAKNQEVFNPTNTIFDLKRIIGRDCDDNGIKSNCSSWPFFLISDKEKEVKFLASYQDKEKLFYPEEIHAFTLIKMKEIAETHAGHLITDAVISVPASFNNSQRIATLNAGKIAGLNVLRLINEPTAAALAYAFDYNSPQRHNVLVYDFGGSTFDVSIAEIHNGSVKILASAGQTELGGETIDARLFEHFRSQFRSQFSKNNFDLSTVKRTLQKLRIACEKLKRILSSASVGQVDVDLSNIDWHIKMYRNEFENLNKDIFESTMQYVHQVLADAALQTSDISEIILIGGSTRIPAIQQLLQNYFPVICFKRPVNPDEAVACGAAIQAAISRGYENKFTTRDVYTFDNMLLDNQIIYGRMTSRNEPIPISKTFYNFPVSSVSLYQVCGDKTFHRIAKLRAKSSNTQFKFLINDSGICDLFCEDNTWDENHNFIVKKDHRSADVLNKMIKHAAKLQEAANTRKQLLAAKYELETYCFKSQMQLRGKKQLEASDERIKENLLKHIDSIISWLDSHVVDPTASYPSYHSAIKLAIDNFLQLLETKMIKEEAEAMEKMKNLSVIQNKVEHQAEVKDKKKVDTHAKPKQKHWRSWIPFLN